MNKELIKLIIQVQGFILLIALIVTIIIDIARFHSIQSGDYDTPWYDNNWIREPYTNLNILNNPSRVYYTVNFTGTELWTVRETAIGDKTWWTIIENHPLENDN